MGYATDDRRTATPGFALGPALFVSGGAGEVTGRAVRESMPGRPDTLPLDFEVVDRLAGVLSPIVSGVVVPPTE